MDVDDHHIGRVRRTCMCSGCGSPILDQFILRVAPDLEWHASCLKCADCGLMLEEMRTCFVRDGKTYCKMDYLKLFGAKCASCKLGFGVSDLVMRARSHVYHVDCFRCVACGRQLVPGDEFALGDEGLLCRVDHDLALDQQLQCGSGGGTIKSLALSPPDSVISEDVGFITTTCNNNNNNNNNNETTTNNNTGTWTGGKSTSGSGGHSSRSGSRSHKGSDQKTTRIRTVLNEKQLHTLRTCYGANPRPDALMKEQLVEMTGLSPRVIRVWFQNKRCKDKKRSILMKQLQLQQQQQQQQQHQQDKNEPCSGDEMWLYHKGAAMMAASPGREAHLQQQLQQHVLAGELHHQYQPPPPPSTSSSSPWQTLNELTELPPEDLDDGSGMPLAPPSLQPGVMTTPFQQLVGTFGPGGSVSAGGELTDDDTVVSLDEPMHRDVLDVHKSIHQTRSSAHLLYATQRLNAPV